MKRPSFFVGVLAVVTLLCCSGSVLAYSGGSGTAADPYQIADANDLIELSHDPNNFDKDFVLTGDIDLAGEVFHTPVMLGTFSGVFDGRGHVISNLTVDTDHYTNVALFLTVGPEGEIRDLHLEGVAITAVGNVDGAAALAGSVHGVVQRCSAVGDVNGVGTVGGLVATVSGGGRLEDCWAQVTVAGKEFVGGLAGFVDSGSLRNCWANGTLNGGTYGGGLAGVVVDANVFDCHAAGVVGISGPYGGGLLGYSLDSTILRSYATSAVNGGETLGGLMGYSEGDTLSQCHASGKVVGGDYAGGLIGDGNGSNLSQCHASGEVEGGAPVGGLIGDNWHGSLTDCFATGAVTGTGFDAGGLVGASTQVVLQRCYASGKVDGHYYVGGLFGNSYQDKLTDCSATGDVTGDASSLDVAGLVGAGTADTLLRCYARGDVKGNSFCAGLIGYSSQNSITDCYATGSVEGVIYGGGLLGYSYQETITRCYAVGSVTISADYAGGFVGFSQLGTVSDCYAWGDARGNNNVGGFIGISTLDDVSACYSIGQVTGNDNVGGFAGTNYHGTSTFTACFLDVQTSGTIVAVGLGSHAGITGHNTATMQTLSTFTEASWDFETIWGMVDYPQFLWAVYNLDLSSSAGGSVVNPGEGHFYVEPGSTVALQAAAADSSFVFSHFEGNFYTGTNPYLLTVNHDYHIRAVFESVLDVLYVDVNVPEGAYQNGTSEHPFASIQAAIEVARPGSTIVIASGTYAENLDLENKSLVLTGVDVNDANDWYWPVIEGQGGGPVVTLRHCHDPNTLLQGLILSNGDGSLTGGIDCSDSNATLANCLIVGNRADQTHGQAGALRAHASQINLVNCTLSDNDGGDHGAGLYADSHSMVTVVDSILWHNEPNEVLSDVTSSVMVQYSDVTGGFSGLGNLDTDPNFVAPGHWASGSTWSAGDYHLEANSPCIDAGDPNAVYELEPMPNGSRVNQGVYGDTPQGSVSP